MKRIAIIAVLVFAAVFFGGCQSAGTDYSAKENWAYCEDEGNKAADVFFICPTVYMGEEDTHNMSLNDEDTKASFLGATNMEKGIYDDKCRFFAPYYRQAALDVYKMSTDEAQGYFDTAFEDVLASFDYYYKNYNGGRPIILAGFSQGADMCLRLLKERFSDEELSSRLVACYAIGWRVTEEDISEYPQLKFAEGESDTGVVVAFNSEAEFIDNSLMIPKGTKTLAINPLSWTNDTSPADKSLNLGACFTDYDGNITSEIPEFTGAYIDEIRGALKVTDVSVEDYPAGLDIFEDGIYHLYDYQFFYRNLEKNVQTRLEAFLNNQ